MITTPFVPTGTIKSFGAFGPKYEVGQLLRPLEDGDWMIEVVLVETGNNSLQNDHRKNPAYVIYAGLSYEYRIV
ncbi:DUF5397 family protein [Photorhabdus tasmaniensis]|uniref:DUF5397 family protein n=1 Tax=Photorhabdus sp. RM323S TaxID=3342828 RepID=UPI0036DEA0D8